MVTNHSTQEQCRLHFQPVREVQESFKQLSGIGIAQSRAVSLNANM